MAGARRPVEITETQALWFRARRGHLAGPGAASPAAAARALVGAQAQQLPPALLALSLRTKGQPTARAIEAELLEHRRLVRTWGQRDTLHVYDPDADWARVVAARGDWQPGGRGGPLPEERAVDRALTVLAKAERPIGRSAMIGVAPASYERAIGDRARAADMDARRLAAARLFWRLARRGDACLAGKKGAEQTYAARAAWFPDLAWPRAPEPAPEAAAALARRYLATYGPATPQDVAHFFGAKVSRARAWLASMEDELVPVACGDRPDLVALAKDARALRADPPSSALDWPLRLIPRWDSMLMGHADKSWTVPDATERRLVWAKAAMVHPVAISRGRVVARWKHAARGRRLAVTIEPLSGWRARRHGPGARREATAVAAHLELEAADLDL